MTKILDTTLRDGSYVVNFQITAEQTYQIAKALDAEGMDFIEIGHGLGLNAGSFDSMRGACNDEEYLEAAAAAWSVFPCPGPPELVVIVPSAWSNSVFPG